MAPSAHNPFLQYVVTLQFPIVVLLTTACVLAGKAFTERGFFWAAGGWGLNFLYLVLSAVSHATFAAPFQSTLLGAAAATNVASSTAFLMCGNQHGKGTHAIYLRRIPTIGIWIATALVMVHASALGPVEAQTYRDFLMAISPIVLVDLIGVASLAVFLLDFSHDIEPVARPHTPRLLALSAGGYALLQLLAFATHPGHPALRELATDIGFTSALVLKVGILIGIWDLFASSKYQVLAAREARSREERTRGDMFKLMHDVATPVSSFANALDDLERRAPKHGQFLVPLSELQSSLARLNAVIDTTRDLLNLGDSWSVVQGDPSTLARHHRFSVRQVANANNLAQFALSAVKPLREENVAVRVNYSSNCCIECVPGEVIRAVINALTNAYDACVNMPQAQISLSTTAIQNPSSTSDPDDRPRRMVEIAVRDTGHGIDEEIAGLIHQPGWSTRFGLGRGYGIPSMNQMVQRNGGVLDILGKDRLGGTQYVTAVVMRFPKVECKERGVSS